MKDLSLSLLSRGCGRFVSSNGDTGTHDGRLDVCFTPQDYYIWKSQDSLLRLSNSGRLLVEPESALPKTYSTRRGPLLLYSQDLVTMETSRHSETRDRKQRVVRRYTQQGEQQLSTLKELSTAILSYSNTQFTSSRLGPLLFPPLHLPLAQDLRHPSPLPLRTSPEQPSPELLVQLNPQLLLAERNAERLENHPEDKEEEQGSRKRVRLDLFLQIPCTSRTPSPQMEPQPWVHYSAKTPEEPEEPQHTEHSHDTEVNHHSTGGERHHPNRKWVCDVADDPGCFIQDSEMTGDEGNYERSMSGARHGRKGLLPPLTVGPSVSDGPCWENKHRSKHPRREGPSGDEHHARRLPPIAEGRSVAPGRPVQAQNQQEGVGFQPRENLHVLHQQPLLLPPLFSGKEEEMRGKQRGGGGGGGGGGGEMERQHFKKETGRGLPSEKGSVVLLEPEQEPPPPVGVLGSVAGRKGPGKQSSLAFLQNRLLDLQDPCESSDANRAVVRGVLPLELRDLHNGKSVGSLILGPDGEIIQLSLYDNNQDLTRADGDAQEKALQVLSAEGETLPWVIVLQPERTPMEAEAEPDTDVPAGHDIQHHQSISHQQLFDADGWTETNARFHGSHTHSEAGVDTRGRDAENNMRMPPLREEEPRGDNSEEDEEEELGREGRTGHQTGGQDVSANEATTEAAVDKRRKNTKRKDAEEAAAAAGKSERKMVKSAASDGQKTSKTRREGRGQRQKTGSDAQPIKRQKQEQRTNREAAETLDNSAIPSVTRAPKEKTTTDTGGERGEVKTDEGKEERGKVARPKEEPAGRTRRIKRRGKLKHRELVVGTHEDPLKKDEVEIFEEVEEEFHLQSSQTSSATQRNNDKTHSEEDADTDADAEHLSTDADTHSSVPSVRSLRSSAAAPQVHQRSSAASSHEAVAIGAQGLASSRGRLSSCSTVMITEEQLMLNPVKPESSVPRKTRREEEEEAAALRLAERAERRRQEVERKRREREEEEKRQQEREQTEERMKSELEEERRRRAEELRLKKLVEEEERRKREEEEQERAKREQALRERERRRQEEKRRQMERLQRMREEEEQRRKAELERLRLEEERRREEERTKLQGMEESERLDYLRRKEREEESRRNEEEQRQRREEEAALRAAEEARLQAELLARQMALLQQQLAFKRGLALETGGLEKTQGISRPWIYSYFTLLQLQGLNPPEAETMTPDL